MNDQELNTSATALIVDIHGAITALADRRAAPVPESTRALMTRGDALSAEAQRRARAGVRVRASADDLSERMLAHSNDVAAFVAAENASNTASVRTLSALLSRSVAMLADMGAALSAPERMAAEADRAYWAADDAERNAPIGPKQ